MANKETVWTDEIYNRLLEMETEIREMLSRCDHPEDISVFIGCASNTRRHGEKCWMSYMAEWMGEGTEEKSSIIDGILRDINSSVLVERVVENEREKYKDAVYKSVITLKNFAEKLEKAV